jgi:hypothetical protein
MIQVVVAAVSSWVRFLYRGEVGGPVQANISVPSGSKRTPRFRNAECFLIVPSGAHSDFQVG